MTEPKKEPNKTGALERRAFGQRLKRAAQAAGFTSETIAETLGVSPGAVRNWWAGKNEPSRDALSHYARITRLQIGYLLRGSDEPMGPTGTLQEWRLRFAELIRQGVEPRAAINQITGGNHVGEPGIAPDRLTEEEKQLLEGAGPRMRQVLEEVSGGQWDRLSDDKKEAILRLIEAMAQDEPEPE